MTWKRQAVTDMTDLMSKFRDPDAVTFGTWVKLPTLETLELLARLSFDFVVIDQEHSPLSLESAYRLIVVGQSLGMGVLVRVPDRSGSYVQRILDAGADGILVPQVADIEAARDAMSQMIFSRAGGSRGMGATSRAGLWGLASNEEYLSGGDRLLRVIQLESREAVQQAEEILQVAGVNAAFLGLGDLTLLTGLALTHPEIQGLISKFVSAAASCRVPCGTAVGTAAAAGWAARQGFDFVMVSNDLSIFASAASVLAKEIMTSLRDAKRVVE